MEPRPYRWDKTSKSSSAQVRDDGTDPGSRVISRSSRDTCRYRLSSRRSSRASIGDDFDIPVSGIVR